MPHRSIENKMVNLQRAELKDAPKILQKLLAYYCHMRLGSHVPGGTQDPLYYSRVWQWVLPAIRYDPIPNSSWCCCLQRSVHPSVDMPGRHWPTTILVMLNDVITGITFSRLLLTFTRAPRCQAVSTGLTKGCWILRPPSWSVRGIHTSGMLEVTL